MLHQDTITAIATAQGGAIGIVRVSGPDAFRIADSVFVTNRKQETTFSLAKQDAYTVHFGQIINPETKEILDEVLVSVFKNPRSYTGEDSVEIACHGSTYILQQVLQLLITQGCRLAQPGEFTQRAFMNGKMDLSQAEAVADLIASNNKATHQLAMNQMRGGFSAELRRLRDQLLHFTSLVELELDFSDHEELEFADRTELKGLAGQLHTVIQKLANSFQVGNAIKQGIPVALIGQTNAGKSTLLNALLQDEKAIVSDIHGTTRDVVEDTINIGGVTYRFIDTAGLRETEDTIEKIGIERSYQKIGQAQIVLWIIDLHQGIKKVLELLPKLASHMEDKSTILLFNKADSLEDSHLKLKEELMQAVSKDLDTTKLHSLTISAKTQEGIPGLLDVLQKEANIPALNEHQLIVTNARHFEALTRALEAINRVRDGLEMEIPGDLLSQDIREAIYYLNDIIGEVTTDQVLGNIFKHFCIGK